MGFTVWAITRHESDTEETYLYTSLEDAQNSLAELITSELIPSSRQLRKNDHDVYYRLIQRDYKSPDMWGKNSYYGEPYVEDDIADAYILDNMRIQDLVKHLTSAEREFERWNKNGSESQPDIDLDELSAEASRIIGRGLKLVEDFDKGVLRFVITERQYQRIW